MTNHTDLIARLRKDDLFWEAPITCRSEAADAIEAAQTEIERLQTTVKHLSDAAANATLLTQGASPVQPSQTVELSTEQLLYVQSALKAVEQYGNIFRYERHQVIRYEKIVDALAIVDAAINAKESGK